MRFLVIRAIGNRLELQNLETREIWECVNPGLMVIEGRTVVEAINDRLVIVSG